MTMHTRLIDYNFSQVSATVLAASSADPSFPVSNLASPIRSRVWRSAGYFVITTANQHLDFDIGGAEKSATIPAATYASADDLAAAILAAMQSAEGTGAYTVSFSGSTGRWTITKSTGTLNLRRNTGTNVATSIWTAIGFTTAANSTGALSYTGTNVAIHTEEWVTLDLQTTEAVDSAVLLFDTIQGMKLSDSAVVKLQANATNSWAAPAVDQTLSFDDTYGTFSKFFSSDQSYRYWRIKIVDPANPYLYVELSTLVLGKGIQLGALPGQGIAWTRKDPSSVQETTYGHRYVDSYPIRKSVSFKYGGLSEADTGTLESSFNRNGVATPVCLAVDPLEAAFDKDRFLLYGFFGNALQMTHVSGTKFQVPLALTEAM